MFDIPPCLVWESLAIFFSWENRNGKLSARWSVSDEHSLRAPSVHLLMSNVDKTYIQHCSEAFKLVVDSECNMHEVQNRGERCRVEWKRVYKRRGQTFINFWKSSPSLTVITMDAAEITIAFRCLNHTNIKGFFNYLWSRMRRISLASAPDGI